MKAIKKSFLSAVLAAAMLFNAACSQSVEDVEIVSESGTTIYEHDRTAAESKGFSDEAAVTVPAEESSPGETAVTEEHTDTSSVSDTFAEDSAATATAAESSKQSHTVTAAVTKAPVVTTAAAAKPPVTAATVTKPPAIITTPVITTAAPEKPVSSNGFKVSGTKLLDANENEFVMRGINHAHVWFRDNLDQALQGIANTGANCVRIVLGDGNSSGGNNWGPTSESEIKNIIQKCKSRNLICILESHNATGSDSVSDLNKAVEYWKRVKNAFIGEEKYVIINIANEWYGSWNNLDKWANAYVDAVKALRSAGIRNTIMVDSAGWGQCAKSVAQYGEKIFNADPEKNTMFSIHMYGSAGGNKNQIKTNIDNVLNKNLCLVIGEFGWNHSDGDVDEDYIMQYCSQKNVGYIAWSWKGNGGGVEYLDISYDWEGNNLSDWGVNLVNNTYGIRKTSKRCTVF